jgi:4-amino-4-deoxy-L-arabinose transferase-like glycosyltransferase
MAILAQDREQPMRLSLKTVATAVGVLTLVRLFVAAHTGLVADEAYYTVWSEQLAPGYLDHPPVVAVMIAVGRLLAGNSPLGVRFVAVLMSLALSGLIWRTGEVLFDRRTALIAVLWYNVAPVAGLDFITTPDPPSALFWMAGIWAVAEFMASGQRAWWLVAGIATGLGLASKYTLAFLPIGLLLFLIVDRERRRWLLHWQIWAAALLALLVFSPVIWWNATHGWASFLFQGRRTSGAAGLDFFANLADFIVGQAGYMTPVMLGFAIAGAVLFLRAPRGPDRAGLALPLLTALPALAYFCYHTLHAQVDANWLIPLWPPLSLVAAYAVVALMDRRPALGNLASILQVGLGLAAMLLIYAQAFFNPLPLGPFDPTSQIRDWVAVDARLVDLARAHQARWVATSRDYGLTGEIASYMLFAGSPLPVRQIDERPRWAFLPPLDPETLGWPALFVEPASNPTPPERLFGRVEKLETITRAGVTGYFANLAVYLVSEPKPAFFAGLNESFDAWLARS